LTEANRIVIQITTKFKYITVIEFFDTVINIFALARIKIPAKTIVDECISDDTGDGPSIASNNQIKKIPWADLILPANSNKNEATSINDSSFKLGRLTKNSIMVNKLKCSLLIVITIII
jgi:hypothetical protein